MLDFLSAFFLKIFETLKAHISGTEAGINKRFLGFKPSFVLANKKLSKTSMHRH